MRTEQEIREAVAALSRGGEANPASRMAAELIAMALAWVLAEEAGRPLAVCLAELKTQQALRPGR